MAPRSRIHATATEVSSPPENAIPTRSPTGSLLRTFDMATLCMRAGEPPPAGRMRTPRPEARNAAGETSDERAQILAFCAPATARFREFVRWSRCVSKVPDVVSARGVGPRPGRQRRAIGSAGPDVLAGMPLAIVDGARSAFYRWHDLLGRHGGVERADSHDSSAVQLRLQPVATDHARGAARTGACR